MRKVLLLLIAALLVATLVVAGCGNTTMKTKNTEAAKILKDSSKAMQSVKSYKAKGSIDIISQAQNASKMNFTFEMQIQQKGPKDFEGQMLVHSSGQDIEMYFANGYAYMKDPTKGWVKQPLADISDLSKLASPADISKLGDAAQNIKITSESSLYYKIAFGLNSDYIAELMGLQKSLKGLTAQQKKNAEAMVKGLQMGALLQIQKPEMYIRSMAMTLSIPNMPTIGSVRMEEKISLSEFNQPVEVNLPADAINAPEVTGSGALTPSL